MTKSDKAVLVKELEELQIRYNNLRSSLADLANLMKEADKKHKRKALENFFEGYRQLTLTDWAQNIETIINRFEDPGICNSACKGMYFCTLKKGHKGSHSEDGLLCWENKMIKKIAEKFNIPENLAQVMMDVDIILTQAKIPHAIVGGIAVGAHTKPRTTKDVDFLVDIKDLPKIQKLFPDMGNLSMPHREGLTTVINGIDVDFISASLEESFLLSDISQDFEVPISGRNSILYLKLDSGRTSDYNDVIQIVKRMSESERNQFAQQLVSREVEGFDVAEAMENFEGACEIADLELNQKPKEASRQFRMMMLQKLVKKS